MSLSLADHFGVAEALFDASGALDPILDVDTRLFIDPALVRVSQVPELKGSYDLVVEHFNQVLRVVSQIGTKGDRFWRQADKMLTFPEIRGLSIGYSSTGTNGSGMGPAMRAHLLDTVLQIVRAGVSDATIFQLVGIFEDGVGPDRISDMLAKIISADLIKFTQRVCSDCGIPMEAHRLEQLGLEEDLPTHPLTGDPAIFVPKDILRDLPVAHDFGDIRWIAKHNDALRQELNHLIGSSWKKVTTSEQKRVLRETFLRQPGVLQEIIRTYLAEEPEPYDFAADRAGEVIWYRKAKQISQTVPLDLSLSDTPTIDEVESVAIAICNHFKSLIEDNQLAPLLYDSDGTRKHESAAQLLFYGIAAAYCKANNLDLSPESDCGRGPVDFKVSRGFEGKVLVELKLTSNGKLKHGFETQLAIYRRAEGTQRSAYLVIEVGGATPGRLANFRQIVKDAGVNAPKVIWVDGTRRQSASKAHA